MLSPANFVHSPCRGPHPFRHHVSSKCVGRHRIVEARAVELEEVDPKTGQVLAPGAVSSALPSESVTAGGFKWAYRKNQPVVSSGGAAVKPDVLLLHGLGSLSYSYRTTMGLLGADGFQAYAPDWIAHGASDKPPSGAKFDHSEAAYVAALDAFVTACGIKQPVALIVQGYILSQYALLWAQQHPDKIDRVLCLNTPLATRSKLRPELAAYKSPIPFLRPSASKPFDGVGYALAGSAYMMERRDGAVYAQPYEDAPAASAAIAATMDKVDFGALVNKVNQGFYGWRKPTGLLFGSADPFIPSASVFEFLDDKRTNMTALTAPAKLGHMPQEDYAEALHGAIVKFLSGGGPDSWSGSSTLKMTKRGVVDG